MAAEPRGTALFADGAVGLEALRFVLSEHREDLRLVVTTGDNEIASAARSAGCRTVCWEQVTPESCAELLHGVTVVFLAWWPHILRQDVLRAITARIVNFHPSLLPYNRGKHYNFWTLIEGTPFGVTLHAVDAGIDTGPVLAQKPIAKSWEDTGATLYEKAQAAMLELFRERYDDIVAGRIAGVPQDPGAGTFHRARELEPASRVDLERLYTGREILNLLRARTFPGKPACFFYDSGRKYEVRIDIRETPRESS